MIDFSELVLKPAVAIFGEGEAAVTFTPLVSQPEGPPFGGDGIFANKAVEVPTEEGVISTVMPVLGIRLADFAVAPAQGDRVTVRDVAYGISDVLPDGQGGADLVLMRA